MDLDRSTTLCLACSSSLPPLKAAAEHSGIFITNCCSRPICPGCISSNPRLARYDPCLACLGGVGAIFAGSSKGKGLQLGPSKNVNVDGAVRDEDTFVVGDDEDDESGDEYPAHNRPASPPPPYASDLPQDDSTADAAPMVQKGEGDQASLKSTGISSSNPYKYYIRPNDNLQGIALRFAVQGRELCRLNNLPPSALSTTPHILHTRAFITLPPSARLPSDSQNVSSAAQAKDRDREQRLARERAEKRLQTMTKEVDWRVAKAYVALADTHDTDADSVTESKEDMGKKGPGTRALESRAVDRYMDDEEWEERERREGRQPAIAPFPYFGNSNGSNSAADSGSGSKPFWRWKTSCIEDDLEAWQGEALKRTSELPNFRLRSVSAIPAHFAKKRLSAPPTSTRTRTGIHIQMALSLSPVLSSLVLLAVLGLFKLTATILRNARSPLGDLPGPKKSHWLYGNILEVTGSKKTLVTLDFKAIGHILHHNDDFRRPDAIRQRLATLLGEGVLFAEGDPHKRQRRVLNPAFGPAQLRGLTEIFNAKSIELRDVWASMITENQNARVDALSWLSKATLDIIGLAGFNYRFDAMDRTKGVNEFTAAFSTAFKSASRRQTALLHLWIPGWILNYLPTAQMKRVVKSKAIMTRIGNGLLAEAKQTVASGDMSGVNGRDILSLLVRANTDKDLPESQRLSDEDVLAQVPTFLVAGHETTSTATSWALFLLTQAPDVQRKLRDELLQVSTDTPTMEELNNLPYLDKVLREVLRLEPPVSGSRKEAMRDCVIPVEKPFLDKYGKTHNSIRINKGDTVQIPIRLINRSKEVWGEDALEFRIMIRPDRWDSIPEAAQHVPGLWGHQLTFSAGPRACIGYKFSILGTKALLFALVRAFEMELAVPGKDIQGSVGGAVQRPFALSEREKGVQLPLIIKPYLS
ncbi:hypothetical protein HWV62_22113 [Athelia sp. TMB]|nr:hypothetical protein HWV62_22113 [Athelia sp. TMB]